MLEGSFDLGSAEIPDQFEVNCVFDFFKRDSELWLHLQCENDAVVFINREKTKQLLYWLADKLDVEVVEK